MADAVTAILAEQVPQIGRVNNLTGPVATDLNHYAKIFSDALGRTIRYRDVPISAWAEKFKERGVPAHVVGHLAAMANLHQQGRYNRLSDDFAKLVGQEPTRMHQFVKQHVKELSEQDSAA